MEPLQPPLPRRLGAVPWAVIDSVAAVLAALTAMLVSWQTADTGGPRLRDGVIVTVLVLAAPLRGRRPRSVLALATAAELISPSLVSAALVAYAIYLIPARCSRREALWLLAGCLAVTTAALAGLLHAPYSPPLVHGRALAQLGVLLVTAAWSIGYAVHRQRLYSVSLHEQAEQQASTQLAEARRALSEERLRIARELHDVVAHTMSVIAVQAGVANHVAQQRPEEAQRALSSIEETSRGALREMRALLGVLREEEAATVASTRQEDACLPAPGLGDLDSLVARTAEAGVTVDLEVSGNRHSLPAGLDLAAYRVVQEAITNVIKHAATGRCRVSIGYGSDAVTIEVVDHGRADGTRSAGTGHGIVGMRERVAMYGGRFTAGPNPAGGFQVTAHFPLTAGAAA